MAELYLCTGKTAANPFFVEETGQKVWTLEEVCYVVLHQEDYMVETLFTGKFISWVKEELGLDLLSDELQEILSNNKGYIRFLMAIFRSTEYVSPAERDQVSKQLNYLQSKTPAELGKLRADRLMERKKYAAAIQRYEELLATEKYMDDRLRGNLLHNLGTAYAGLFLYEKASAYYHDAYRYNHRQESYRQYLHATHLVSEDTSFGKDVVFLEPSQVEDLERELEGVLHSQEAEIAKNSVSRIKDLIAANDRVNYEKEFSRLLLRWKQEYVKMTTFEV